MNHRDDIKKCALLQIAASVLVLCGMFFSVAAQQTIILFTETFENYNGSFILNTSGPGANTGDNVWIINNDYNGQGIYPNTTRQDSVTSGTITNAPFSTYLHIHNQQSGINNNNFNNTAASDRFASMAQGYCTLGLENVQFEFFYVSEGDADNYGELYYSIDGGPWIKTGQAKYYGQSKWKFERVSNPAFDNVNDLRFGFRWVNNNAGGAYSQSFSIDEIILSATYDNVNNPVTISIAQAFPNPVCRLNSLILQYQLSKPLCSGLYSVELSNSSGNFNNPINLGVFSIGNLDSTGFIAVTVPGNIPLGNCYKVRIKRNTPQPQIIGTASVCINVINCPNIINTISAVVTTDPDTVCARSAIDIQFTSTGVYNNNNRYIAELSDSAGNFTNPLFIGELASSETYDPAIGAMPGTVSGLIPAVPEGCNYYVRVRSTNPAATGTLYGPFCIKHCDIETNLTQDIHICIKENEGATDTVEIVINYWDSIARYCPTNQFIVQLLDMMTLAVVNTGALGAVYDTTSGILILYVPGRNQLLSLGIQPGVYYMRIIADCSSTPWNDNGTIVRLTIGAPNDNAGTILLDDTVFCNTEIVLLTVAPWNPQSSYEWYSNGFVPNPVVVRNTPSILVNFNGVNPDDFQFFVREINYGCAGPFSAVANIYIISSPNVNINGPPRVCLGDTVNFKVLFITETYYEWSVTNGTIIDTANNEITVIFDQLGTATVSLEAVNKCGSQAGSIQIEVITPFNLNAYPDTTVCSGSPVELHAALETPLEKNVSTTFSGTVTRNGVMFDIKANQDINLEYFETHLPASGSYNMAIYYRVGTYQGFETDVNSWILLATVNAVTSAGNNQPTRIPVNLNFPVAAGERYGIYITCTNNANMRVSNGTTTGALYATDGILEIYEGAANQYPFGAFIAPRVWNGKIIYTTYAGLQYQWSHGATTQSTVVYPQQSQQYYVLVSDTTGCSNYDTVSITVLPSGNIFAGNDTVVCYGGKVPVNAIAGNNFTWTPTEGIENPNSLNTIISPQASASYILEASDPQTGCIARDTLNIIVTFDEATLDTVQFCKGKLVEVAMPFSFNEQYLWNTGETTRSVMVSKPLILIGTYTKDASGCLAKAVYDVQMLECDQLIQVPQAFTPDGDGINDYFTIFGKNIVQYEIRIFNRWGELVYHSTNPDELNDLNRGWDGTHKGKLQNTATFVYYITARDINNIPIELKGNVTLIR
jgi:gliding motility-associated-like protein